MTETDLTVVVLRDKTHGLSASEYADELNERLANHDVLLASTREEEHEYIAEAEIATGMEIDEKLIDSATELELFACTWAGTEHLPKETMRERGVALTNASGIHAPNIAETVLGFILVFARQLHEGWKRQRRREWRHYQGYELQDSTVTVLGMGSIGQAVLERLAGFNVETIGVRYTPSKGGPADEVIGFDSSAVHEALAETDYLVIACPLTETTRNFVDAEAFKTLPPESVLVNVSRGEVVDTDALVSEVRSQGIRGAALDVVDPEPLPADHPLWGFDNVFITPHNAGHSPEHWPRMAEVVSRNVAIVEETGSYDGLKNQILRP